MPTDLLQQLKDIHVPPAPGWWPPAPGWWVVATFALVAAALLARTARRAWLRRQPIRRARALHAELARQRRDEEIDAREYANACNELLKRLFVHGLGIDAARRMSGQRWLAMLDTVLGEPVFTRGPGQSLGEARFTPAPSIDAAALEALVTRLLATVSPRLRARIPGQAQ